MEFIKSNFIYILFLLIFSPVIYDVMVYHIPLYINFKENSIKTCAIVYRENKSTSTSNPTYEFRFYHQGKWRRDIKKGTLSNGGKIGDTIIIRVNSDLKGNFVTKLELWDYKQDSFFNCFAENPPVDSFLLNNPVFENKTLFKSIYDNSIKR